MKHTITAAYLALVVGALADDFCRRMCAQDAQEITAALGDPVKVAAMKAALQ